MPPNDAMCGKILFLFAGFRPVYISTFYVNDGRPAYDSHIFKLVKGLHLSVFQEFSLNRVSALTVNTIVFFSDFVFKIRLIRLGFSFHL